MRIGSIGQLFSPRRGIFCFNYHQVGDRYDPRYHHRYTYTDLSHFRAQLAYLKGRFDLISLVEALTLQERGEIDGRYACITVDDGDRSLRTHTIPVLEELSIPATLFINSAYLKNTGASWVNTYQYLCNSGLRDRISQDLHARMAEIRGTGDTELYRRTRSEIEELFHLIPIGDRSFFADLDFLKTLNDSLIHVGLHGHEHQRYSMMTPEWQREDLTRNVRALAELPAYRPIFAIPYGRPFDWTHSTIGLCFELGLSFAFANGGRNNGDEVGLRRIPADGKALRWLV